MSDREKWLNGWPKVGSNQVLIGSGTHCIGCGRSRGVTCVVFEEGYQPPEKLPNWPFEEESCPLCKALGFLVTEDGAPEGLTLQERLAAFKAAKRDQDKAGGSHG